MSDQEDNKPIPRQSGKARLWTFLNSNFGLFVLSSFVVSFMTWAYTEFSHSIEQRELTMESVTKLNTEVSYRIQLIENYFKSECADEKNLKRQTLVDIQEIYRAVPKYQSIFPENKEKDLHILLWELAALQNDEKKRDFLTSFNSMLSFNVDLNRLLNSVNAENDSPFPVNEEENNNSPFLVNSYGRKMDLAQEVAGLIDAFAEATTPIKDELLRTDPAPP